MNRYFIWSALAILALCGLHARAAEPSGLLELNAAQVKGLALKFAAAQDASDYQVANLPGVVSPPPDARIAVAATFPGVVVQTLAVEGDTVRRGQVLAIVASREILTLAADLAGARARLAAAEANAKRQRTLAEEGIVSGGKAEEADANLQVARAEADEKSRTLQAVSADGAKGTYSLTAPLDGTVARASLHTGEPIESMTAAFVVDATGRYEVQAQVPERLIGQVAPGMRVAVDGKIEGKVTSVGRSLQPETRSANLKAAITKGGENVVAGSTVSLAVYAAAPPGAVKVPRGAVADLKGESAVFVQAKDGVLVRKVKLSPSVGGDAVVLAGLAAGESVAVSNLSELKTLALAQ